MKPFITKVKAKDGEVIIKFKEDLGNNTEKESIFKCNDEMHPDFQMCFTKLIPVVYQILQLPEEWRAGEMRVTGVSFSHSESTEVDGAVITGLVNLSTSNSPFSFNTPHLPFDQYSEKGNSPTMNFDAVNKLEHLKEEALAYMNGKRAQADLFDAAERW
jgi:hypothetical protein